MSRADGAARRAQPSAEGSPPDAICELSEGSRWERFTGLVSRNPLAVLFFAVVIVFWRLLPGTFLTAGNISSVLSIQSVGALVALGILVPLVCNQFDLSVGYLVGLVNIFAIGFQSENHLSWEVTVVISLCFGVFVGAVNGAIVTRWRVNSFIATLGTGSVLFGIGLWYTGGQELIGTFPKHFTDIGGSFGGVPLPPLYVAIASIALWLTLQYLRVGRQLYVIGASERTAELIGIRSQRHIVGAFIVSGFLTAVAGVVLAAELRSGSSTTGPEYLLPAFAAIFLGTTSVHPGRPNVWGTVWALLLMAAFVTGLQEEGQSSWVQPFFNGILVVAAVAASGYVLRKKGDSLRALLVRGRLSAAPEKYADQGTERRVEFAAGPLGGAVGAGKAGPEGKGPGRA